MGRSAAYSINGTGRDTYIAVDNGGFSKPFEPSFTPETGVFGSRRLNRDPSAAFIDAKHTNYSSNGSGRDGYISRINGGFYPEQPVAAYKLTYVEQLRHYPRPRTPIQYCRPKQTRESKRLAKVTAPNAGDPYLMSQSFYIHDRQALKENIEMRLYQKTLDNRLSAPKRREQKFHLRTIDNRS